MTVVEAVAEAADTVRTADGVADDVDVVDTVAECETVDVTEDEGDKEVTDVEVLEFDAVAETVPVEVPVLEPASEKVALADDEDDTVLVTVADDVELLDADRGAEPVAEEETVAEVDFAPVTEGFPETDTVFTVDFVDTGDDVELTTDGVAAADRVEVPVTVKERTAEVDAVDEPETDTVPEFVAETVDVEVAEFVGVLVIVPVTVVVAVLEAVTVVDVVPEL